MSRDLRLGAEHHSENFGNSTHVPNESRSILCNLRDAIKDSFENDYHWGKDRNMRKRPRSWTAEFKRFSGGFDWQTTKRAKKKAKANDGVLPAQTPTGPKPKEPLTERIPDLDPFIQKLVDEAKMGGYLTVGIIRQELMSRHKDLHEARPITKHRAELMTQGKEGRDKEVGRGGLCWYRQTLDGSFSAVSRPIFASKC